MRRFTPLCCASAVLTAISAPVFAGDITTEWGSVRRRRCHNSSPSAT